MSREAVDYVVEAIALVARHGWKLLPDVCVWGGREGEGGREREGGRGEGGRREGGQTERVGELGKGKKANVYPLLSVVHYEP